MTMSIVQHKRDLSADTDRNNSPGMWADCPLLELAIGSRSGIRIRDDFLVNAAEDGADTDGYQRYIDTSNTIRNLVVDVTALATGSRGGVLRLATDATDNDGPTIQQQNANGGAQILIGNTAGAAWKLYFEARIRKTIADDGSALFVGLAQLGTPADNGLLADDTGDLVDSISAIGWRVKHVNGGTTGQNAKLDFVYQDAAQTVPVVTLASAATMVASTWIKVGFVYDPNAIAAEKIRLYINGQEQSSYVTTANIDAATFPENDAMSFVFGAKNGSATAMDVDIDWYDIVQLYD